MEKVLSLIALAMAAMMASSAHAESRVISASSGGQVEFQLDGTGPAILMIPSLGRGASDFDDLSRRLVGAGFTTVRPEPRGRYPRQGHAARGGSSFPHSCRSRAAPDAQW